MRKFSALGWCLLTAVFAFYRPGPALAVTSAAVSGNCSVFGLDCKTADPLFVPTAARVSVSAGVTTAECVGTTPTLPGPTAKGCDGEFMNRNLPSDGSTTAPCNITLGGASVAVDDWHETISTAGIVKLTCKVSTPDIP
jgi:hypothetical protein